MRLLLLKTATILGALLYSGTEFLGFFRSLTFTSVLYYWIAALSLTLFICRRSFSVIHLPKEPFTKIEGFIFWITGALILFLGWVAISFPPNNFDAMTYHMARIPHWIQNRSINYYATHIPRQLWYSPFAEYVILHFQILTGSDILANAVQWLAFVGSCVGASLIAQHFGAQRIGQLLTAFCLTTLPMAIAQSTSTQNDLMLSFWLIVFIVFILRLSRETKISNVFFAAMALGLGILTKGGMYIIGGLFLLSYLFLNKKSIGIPFWKIFLILFIGVLFFNTPHYLRNQQYNNSFISPSVGTNKVENEDFSPRGITSQLLKHIALHLDTPIKPLNTLIEKSYVKIHQWMNYDINDPRTTFSGKFIIHKVYDENATGNFRHLLFFLLGIGIFFSHPALKKNKALKHYLFITLFTFFLFAICVKWQLWASRLHLPIFIMLTPFLGITLSEIKPRPFIIVLVIVFLGCSMPWLLKNPQKRIISSKKTTLFNASREKLYFITEGAWYPAYDHLTDALAATGCPIVGLTTSPNGWEYPLWVLLKNKTDWFYLNHINVTNPSQKYIDETFIPCAIIALQDAPLPHYDFHGHRYNQIFTEDRRTLYLKAGPIPINI